MKTDLYHVRSSARLRDNMRCVLMMVYLAATAVAFSPLRATVTNRIVSVRALPGEFIGAPLRAASGMPQRSVQASAKRGGAMTMGLFGLGVPEIAVILAMGKIPRYFED